MSVPTEETLFQDLHEGLMAYIHHRISDDDRANDVYEQIIDQLIDLTE